MLARDVIAEVSAVAQVTSATDEVQASLAQDARLSLRLAGASVSRSPGRHARNPGQWRHHLGAPNAGIVPLRALDASGSGRAWDIAAALAWAADHGARVVDASLSGIGPSRVMADGATPRPCGEAGPS